MVKAHQMAEVESEQKQTGDAVGDGTVRKGETAEKFNWKLFI